MQVSSYTFQTPYPQPLQVGRPDPSSVKEEKDESLVKQEEQKKRSSESQQNSLEQFSLKSSSLYQNDESYKNTEKILKEYMATSMEAKKSQNLNLYASNNNDVVPLPTSSSSVLLE